ncbi:MAG: outer membrane beta-barrel protein [Pseudomonadota bacterium]
MLKKVLTAAVLGVSTLSIMAANAADPGIYITGQLGYAKTHLGSKTNIADINNNLPMGSTINLDNGATNISNDGFAGRLALGYQFNENFALELGYMQLRPKKVHGEFINNAIAPVPVTIPGSISLNQNAIDVAAKGIIPIASNFSVYAKLGVAYLTTTLKGKLDIPDDLHPTPASIDLNTAANIAKHKWAPEAAIGVSYDITPNVSIDTSWTHIQPLGKNRPGNIDFVAVGVGYNFG